MRKTAVCLLALCGLGSAAPALATTITFQELVSPSGSYTQLSQDFRGSGTTNNGTQTLVGYQTAGVLEIRTVMGYDLSAIPAGSTINSVSLRLVSDGSQSGTIAGVGTVNLHEVVPNGVASNNMVEGQVSRTTWKTGSNWTTILGDFTATPMSTGVLNNANSNTTLDGGETATFGSTTAFVTAAQNSFDAGLPLEFILIAPTAEAATGASNFYRFRSDDFTTTASDRPLLTIDYTVPEPSAGVATLGFAGLAMLPRRRRAAAAK
jgi:hypothetical protein